ncbi:MAG TPA: hypothetical protein V6D50_15775 [Chroococcales cyanobacterium]|jgi:hypothetical protein
MGILHQAGYNTMQTEFTLWSILLADQIGALPRQAQCIHPNYGEIDYLTARLG